MTANNKIIINACNIAPEKHQGDSIICLGDYIIERKQTVHDLWLQEDPGEFDHHFAAGVFRTESFL
jgi:hypothetical protein